jgi:ribosomal protein S18 acetylase RimI-like enzyme
MDAAELVKISFDEDRIGLRRVTANDREFLLEVYASGREIELSMFPWTETQKREFVEHQFDAQTAYYLEKFPVATHDLILFEGEPVGRVYVNRGDDLISILDLAVLTRWRKRGIGTSVITSLQKEAEETGRRLGVYVENFNPSQMLFRKLGFSVASEDEMNVYLEWKPTGI